MKSSLVGMYPETCFEQVSGFVSDMKPVVEFASYGTADVCPPAVCGQVP